MVYMTLASAKFFAQIQLVEKNRRNGICCTSVHVISLSDTFLQLFGFYEPDAAIKRLVLDMEHMGRMQLAIAVPNRSLFLYKH